MTRRIICLLIAAASAIGAVPLFAQQETTAPAGTLTLDKKTYTLKRALAYETTIDDEDAIAVVLSGQPVTSEMLKEARDAEKEGGDPSFKRPFLRLVFKKTGELKYWSAAAGGTMLGRHSGAAPDGRSPGQRAAGIGGAARVRGRLAIPAIPTISGIIDRRGPQPLGHFGAM